MEKLVFDKYVISSDGTLFSLKSNNFIKLTITHKGYGRYHISSSGKQFYCNAHKLVAESFIPNTENKPQVNHINGIKTDNRVENLEWCTQSENQIHRYRVLGHRGTHFGKFGKETNNYKSVIQYTKEGEFIKYWDCMTDALRFYNKGISNLGNIIKCCKGKRKTAFGFIWKYN